MEFLIDCMDDLTMEQQKVCVFLTKGFQPRYAFTMLLITRFSFSSNIITEMWHVSRLNSRHGFRNEGTFKSNETSLFASYCIFTFKWFLLLRQTKLIFSQMIFFSCCFFANEFCCRFAVCFVFLVMVFFFTIHGYYREYFLQLRCIQKKWYS